MNVLITPRAVEQVSDRIERAYLRHHPEWRQAGLDPRLWVAAAAIMMDAHRADSSVPVDPELFVACQNAGAATDPWSELTSSSSRRRYLAAVRKIVRGLRRELAQELRRIDSAEDRGEEIELILLGASKKLSPLGRYLAACQRHRNDLADRLRPESQAQHECCPLYRLAARGLIDDADYPVISLFPESLRFHGVPEFSLN